MNIIKKVHYYLIYLKLFKINKLDKFHSQIIADQIINFIYKPKNK